MESKPHSDREEVPATDSNSPLFRVENRKSIWFPYLFPIVLALAVILGSLASSIWLRFSEDKALKDAVKNATEHLTNELGKELDFTLHPLFALGWRWNRTSDQAMKELKGEAHGIIDASNSTESIIWLNRSGEVAAAIPNVSLLNDLNEDASFNSELENRLQNLSQRVGATAMVMSLPDNQGVGLAAIISARHLGYEGVYVLGLYDLNELLDAALTSEGAGYLITLGDSTRLLWTRGGDGAALSATQVGKIDALGLDWTVTLNPGPEIVATYRSNLPMVILVGGSILGILLGLSVSIGFSNKMRAEKMTLVNSELTREAWRRAQAEAGEQEAKTELEQVLEQLPVLVWSAYVTSDGVMLPERTIKLPALTERPLHTTEAWPESWYEAILPEDRGEVESKVDGLSTGEFTEAELAYRVLAQDGSVMYLEDTIRSRPWGDGWRMAGVIRDVTEIRKAEIETQKLEERFEQAQKLESLGVLAGGIAHDFNNLLVGVLGHARLASEDLPNDSPVQKSIQSIDRAARRAADLCRQMLAYAGKVPVSIATLDLRESVEEIGELLRASISSSSVIDYEFDTDISAIQADGSQVQQVVLNLITNAAEALGDSGGKVRLSVKDRTMESTELSQMNFGDNLAPGRYVVLTVADTGCGMDEVTQRRIFEPFYSTKFTGRGLGLAAVIGIVRGHGGGIRIESSLGLGTSISVAFPASDKKVVKEETIHPDADWRGSGKVLVVEDEESARELASIVLKRTGFEVLEAKDGLEGVEVFRENKSDIRCVLLDLAMPNMDGDEAHREIRKISAEVPTILCSGYPEQDAVSRFSDLNPSGFIEKPYNPETLIARVREAVEGKGDA